MEEMKKMKKMKDLRVAQFIQYPGGEKKFHNFFIKPMDENITFRNALNTLKVNGRAEVYLGYDIDERMENGPQRDFDQFGLIPISSDDMDDELFDDDNEPHHTMLVIVNPQGVKIVNPQGVKMEVNSQGVKIVNPQGVKMEVVNPQEVPKGGGRYLKRKSKRRKSKKRKSKKKKSKTSRRRR